MPAKRNSPKGAIPSFTPQVEAALRALMPEAHYAPAAGYVELLWGRRFDPRLTRYLTHSHSTPTRTNAAGLTPESAQVMQDKIALNQRVLDDFTVVLRAAYLAKDAAFFKHCETILTHYQSLTPESRQIEEEGCKVLHAYYIARRMINGNNDVHIEVRKDGRYPVFPSLGELLLMLEHCPHVPTNKEVVEVLQWPEVLGSESADEFLADKSPDSMRRLVHEVCGDLHLPLHKGRRVKV